MMYDLWYFRQQRLSPMRSGPMARERMTACEDCEEPECACPPGMEVATANERGSRSRMPSKMHDKLVQTLTNFRNRGEGHFTIRGLPDKEYWVAAVHSTDKKAVQNFLAKKYAGWHHKKLFSKKIHGKTQYVGVIYKGPNSAVGMLPKSLRPASVKPYSKKADFLAGTF